MPLSSFLEREADCILKEEKRAQTSCACVRIIYSLMCKDICLFSHTAIKHIVATDNERQMICLFKRIN